MTDKPDDQQPLARQEPGRHRAKDRSLLDRLLRSASLHTEGQARRWSSFVVGYLAVAFYLTGWVWPRAFRTIPELNFYLVQPLVWSGLALLAYLGWRRLPLRPLFRWSLVRAGVLVGLFHLSVLVIAAVFVGFGRSGAGNKLINYPLNSLYLGTLLGGLEMTRAYLYAVWKERSERATFGLVTLLIFVAATPVARFLSLDELERVFRIGGGLLLPALVVSGVATWMARSGPGPAMAYQAVLLIPDWFSPIQPDPSWTLALLLGTVTPLVGLALYRALGEDDLPEDPEPDGQTVIRDRPWLRWGSTAIAVVLIFGFFTGAFGVRPYVVSGISMEPSLEAGDLVILHERFNPDELAKGDIVKYDRGSLPVVHRIVSVEDRTGKLVVTTKGDNVLSPDPPVDLAAIDGKVVFAIPWIGKVALWARGD